MAKFTAVPGLNELVAEMIAPELTNIAEFVADKARSYAPPTKKWRNVGDSRVRPSHVHAGGQEVPDNLRFELTAFEWDVKHPGASRVGGRDQTGDGSGWDGPAARTVPGVKSFLKFPRDHTGGHLVQILNCRCGVVMDPDGVAKLVKVEAAVARGTKVTATVVAEGSHVHGAEYGDVYPSPVLEPVAKGTFFMHRAAVAAENELRARR